MRSMSDLGEASAAFQRPSPPALEVARAALDRFAWDEARGLLLQAIADDETPESLELLTRACRWLHDERGTLDAGERAFLLYMRSNDHRSAARTAMWLAIDVLELRGHDAVANGWLARSHRLLRSVGAAPEHCMLAGIEAYIALMAHNDATRAIQFADEGLARAPAAGAMDAQMACLAVKGLAMVTSGRVTEGMTLLDEACTAALDDEIADPTLRSTILCALMDACDRIRDFQRASQWSIRIREAAERWSLPMVTTVCRPHYAVVLAWRGHWDAAAAELTTAIDEYRQVRPLLAVEAVTRLAELRLRQGKIEEAAQLFSRVEHDRLAQPGRAEFALTAGDAPQAADIIDRHLRQIPTSDLVERAPALEVLVRAAIEVGDRARAVTAAAELRTIAQQAGTIPLRAAASRAAGLLDMSDGNAEAARVSLEDALDQFSRDGALYESARTRVLLGRALAAAGKHDRAADEWARARDAFRSLGASLDSALVGKLLARRVRGNGHAPTVNGLTGREVEIIQLVAGGQTNQDIAEVLVLSVRTVERHLSNIYSKFGLNGRSARAAIAARAFEWGLVSPR